MARSPVVVMVLAAPCLLAAPLANSAGASPDADLARTAKKAKKCKAKQVSVTVGRSASACAGRWHGSSPVPVRATRAGSA